MNIEIREEKEMSIRCIMMGSYNAEGAKGIIGGSDRMAAVKTVAEAAGGSVNFASLEVHECIDNGPVVAAAQRIMKAYVPANA